MNFDFGEVLTRAGQITWKYKSLWLAGIVITLIGFLSAPISLMLNPVFSSFGDPEELNRQMPLILLSNGVIFLLSILSIPLYAIGLTIPSLGALQVEKGSEQLRFGELVKGSLRYFWRILGIFLLVMVGIFLVMTVFMAFIAGVSLVTFGMGAICAFPIFFLFIPAGLLVYAVMEEGIAAVLVDDLGVFDALQRSWELVKKNLGAMLLLGFIIYLGSAIVSTIISIPVMIPMFGYMNNMIQSMGSRPDFQLFEEMYRSMMWWMLAFSPIYAVFQGILLTFMQAAWTLTYMRLTKPQDNAPVILEANA